MTRLLIDQGLPRSTATILRACGMDVVHVGELGAFAASDTEILDMARQSGRTVVTLDADFHRLLAFSRASSPIRDPGAGGLDGPALATLLRATLLSCGDDLEAAAAVTVQQNRIGIRRLPLVR